MKRLELQVSVCFNLNHTVFDDVFNFLFPSIPIVSLRLGINLNHNDIHND